MAETPPAKTFDSTYPDSSKKNIYTYLLSGIAIAVFLLISFPGNRSETDDGYSYAYFIGHYPFADQFRGKFVLFLPFFKFIYNIYSNIIGQPDAYLFMCSVSALCSTVTILLCYRILQKYFQVSKAMAAAFAGLILFSYGFWRYSVEAEVYALANLLNCIVLLLILKATSTAGKTHTGYVILASAVAAFSVLCYKPNFVPVMASYPLIFLLQKKVRWFIIFQAVCIALILVGYYAAYVNSSSFQRLSFTGFINSETVVSGGNPLLAIFIFAENITGLNFIFGIDSVTEIMQKKLASKDLVAEIYTAKFNGAFNYVAIATFILVTGLALFLLYRYIVAKEKTKFTARHALLAVHFVLYMAIVIYFDPNSPEPFVMAVVPFWLLVGSTVGKTFEKKNLVLPLYLFIAALLLHNIAAGYLMYRNKNTDYLVYRSNWLLAHARQGDVILSDWRSGGLAKYMKYHSAAEVFWIDDKFEKNLPVISKSVGKGHIYLIRQDDKTAPKNRAYYQQFENFLTANNLTPVAVTDTKYDVTYVFELK
ncbi:protein O-mannosyl-transferase family [Foetidibacter luteolus]|uniref:protein O-mannosyl-transferase family n=1 Tax=Foetidibacter luteolus TaxID=2608880 RepID=UPI00129A654A|nr:DUF2723 domain-containing protein [Foetidibacter luteolus]